MLLLDEPTNDIDVNTLRALEEGLDDFAGCAVVVSHDRWFLDRICTHILSFEGDGNVVFYEGSYSDYEEYKNGVRTDGVFFSGQSFITKLAMGVSSLISGFIYSAVHYTAEYIETLNLDLAAGKYHFYEANDGKYAMAMFLLISIPPAIGMLLSAIPTLKYSLTDKEHTRILNELIERRASKNNGNND